MRVQAFGERIIEQKACRAEPARIKIRILPATLECGQKTGMADLVAQRVVGAAIRLCGALADDVVEPFLQVGLDAIMIKQRVVDVEQESEMVMVWHVTKSSFGTLFVCQHTRNGLRCLSACAGRARTWP